MSVFSQLMMRKKIPAIYKVLDWIKSTGTQYIDMGVTSKANQKAKYSFMPTTISTGVSYAISGAYTENNSSYFGIIRSADGKLNYRSYINFVPCGDVITTGTQYDVEVVLNNNSQSMTCNGANATSSYPTADLASNLYLFKISNLPTQAFIGRVYYFSLWQNNVLVRNLIPVRRLTDNEVGMYDTVSKTFFGNVGTGKFIGSDE